MKGLMIGFSNVKYHWWSYQKPGKKRPGRGGKEQNETQWVGKVETGWECLVF